MPETVSRASIVLQRGHALARDDALAAARRIGDELSAAHGCRCRWEGEVLHFTRTGVSGTLEIGDSDVALQVRLGFLLAGFSARIEKTLDENFERYFGAPSASPAPAPAPAPAQARAGAHGQGQAQQGDSEGPAPAAVKRST